MSIYYVPSRPRVGEHLSDAYPVTRG